LQRVSLDHNAGISTPINPNISTTDRSRVIAWPMVYFIIIFCPWTSWLHGRRSAGVQHNCRWTSKPMYIRSPWAVILHNISCEQRDARRPSRGAIEAYQGAGSWSWRQTEGTCTSTRVAGSRLATIMHLLWAIEYWPSPLTASLHNHVMRYTVYSWSQKIPVQYDRPGIDVTDFPRPLVVSIQCATYTRWGINTLFIRIVLIDWSLLNTKISELKVQWSLTSWKVSLNY